ncbi:MAG: hypothetical protein F7B19_01300 [Desulfurococcales archaeon]|nr:hypothetical protein [Desulfurococcales archaeon]
MPTGLFPEWMQSILLLIFIGLAIALALQQTKELKRLQMPSKKRVYSIVKCGDKETQREFREGDYIGKKVECGEQEGLITKIYAIYPKTGKNEKPMKT